jgi:heme A synthase
MNAIIAAGYPYELAGICYYVLFLLMSRRANAAKYSLRSRLLVIVAAVVMVGCVPFRYASVPLAVIVMLGLAVLALLSTLADSLQRRRP